MIFQTVVKLPSLENVNAGGVRDNSSTTTGFLGNGGGLGVSTGASETISAPNKSFSMLHLTNGGCVLSTVPLFHDMDDNRREARA